MNGNPTGINQWNKMSELEHWLRLWSNVEKTPKCWIWTGIVSGPARWRYGSIGWGGKTVRASRLIYSLTRGDVPPELHVLHTCDNTLCVRPDHLFLGTQLDNMRDAKAKGRDAWSKKTHCKSGHSFTGDNIAYGTRQGYVIRYCRTCQRRNAIAYKARKAARA